MNLDHPLFLWLLLLLPVELLVSSLRFRLHGLSAARLAPPRERAATLGARRVAGILAAISSSALIVFASLALAGPSWDLRAERVERSGLEIAVALDVSRSMEARDAAPSPGSPASGGARLEAAKALLRVILGRRAGDAFSLTVIKGEGLLLVPMTEDLDAVDGALDWADPSAMTSPGTDLGRGLETALGSFSSLAGPGRLLLLLSDGGDLGGSARSAALAARARGVRLLAVGFGGQDPAPIPGPDGAKLLGADGTLVRVVLEAGPLRNLASVTGGRFFDAGDGASLPALVAELEAEGGTGTRVEFRVREEAPLFVLLALASLVLRFAAAAFALGLWRLLDRRLLGPSGTSIGGTGPSGPAGAAR